MDASRPLRPIHVKARACGALGVHVAVEVTSATFAKEVCVVSGWTDGNGFGGTAEEVAHIVGL